MLHSRPGARGAAPWLFSLLIQLLAGCAATPVTQHGLQDALSSYSFDGRFSLRQGEQNHSGRISWAHSPDHDLIMIADPFGSGVAELERRPGVTRLTLADGRTEQAGDAAALMRRLTGIPLPVGAIGEWLTGRFPPDSAGTNAGVEIDELGRSIGIARDGWRLRFDYAEDIADALPARIHARRDDALELRLSIERWEIPQ